MGREIDERVVQMKFENGQFEHDVQTSIHSLDELKKGLDFKDASKGFQNIDKAAKDVKLDPMLAAVEALNSRFNLLGITAFNVMNRISNAAINTAETMIRSLSVDNISTGWGKYAQKTSSVQTIMAATAKEFSDTAVQMEFVNEQLDRLNWFTDETSYNFLDMVNNIGKFTSNNIPLDQSVVAMQGIANWAAKSGANAAEASRAMYNLSQAIAVGSVKLIDWKSIENANMATAEFKETVIQTAIEAGTLKKVGDKVVTAVKGSEVSVSNFNEALSEAWFSSDVLLKSLDKYGAAAIRLNEIYEQYGILTSDIIAGIDDYTSGVATAEEVSKDWGIRLEDTKEILKDFESETMQFGLQAFKAAQEAKTFQDAIDSVKDAVSTGWMTTFEIIFGDFTKAKELWTSLANSLYDIFAAGAEARNEMLRVWSVMGGRDYFVAAIFNSLSMILSILNPIKFAFQDVFGTMRGRDLRDLTRALNDLIKRLTLTPTAMAKVRRTARGLFAVLDILRITVVECAKGAFDVMRRVLEELNIDLFDFTGNIADGLLELRDWVKSSNKIETVFKGIGDILVNVIRSVREFIARIKEFGAVKTVLDALEKTFNSDFKGIQSIVDLVYNTIMSFIQLLKTLPLVRSVDDLKEVFTGFANDIVGNLNDAGISFDGFFQLIQKAFTKMKDIFDEFVGGLKGATDGAASSMKTLSQKLQEIDWAGVALVATGVVMMGMIWKIADALTQFAVAMQNVTDVGKTAKGALNSIKGYFDALKNEVTSRNMIKLAAAIGILAASLYMIAQLNWRQLATGTAAIVALTFAFGHMAKQISKIENLPKIGLTLLSFASSIGMLALAIRLVPTEDLLARVGVIGLAMVGLVGVATYLSKHAGSVDVGVVSVIGMAAGIYLMIGALQKISSLNAREITGAIPILAAIMLVLGAFYRLTTKGLVINKGQKVKTIASFTSVIGLVIGLLAMCSAIKRLGSLDFGTLTKGLIAIEVLMLTLKGVLKTISGVSTYAVGVGSLLVGFAAAMWLMISVVKRFATVSPEELKRAALPILALSAVFGAMVYVSQYAGASAAKAGLMILSMAGAMAILQLVVKTLGRVDVVSLAKGTLAVAALILSFAPLVKASVGESSANTIKGLQQLNILIGLLAVAVFALSAMPLANVLGSAAALSSIVLALSLFVKNVNKMEPMDWALFAQLSVLTGAIGALIFGLSYVMKDGSWVNALAIAGGTALVVTALGLCAKLISGAKFPTKETLKALREFVGTLGLVMIGLAALSSIAKPVEFLALTTGMSEMFISLAVAGRIMDKTKNPSVHNTRAMAEWINSVGGIMIALAIVQATINALGGSTEGVLTLTTGMSEIIISLAAAARIMGRQTKENVYPSGKDVFKLAAIVAAIGGVIALMSNITGSPEQALSLATAMSEVLIALSISLRLMTGMTGKIPAEQIGSLTLITLIASIMGMVLAALSQMTNPATVLPVALGLSAVMLALSGCVNILFKTPPAAISGAWSALGMLAIIVAALGVLAIAMGALYQDPMFQKILGDSGQAMILLGEAIGGFVGGIIGGFVDGALTAVMQTIPAFGTALSDFMTNIQPFLDGLNDIPGGAIGLIAELLGVLLAFTAAEFVAGIGELPIIGDLLDKIFGSGENKLLDNFSALGEALKAFSDSLGDMDVDRVKTATEAAKMLGELENNLPRQDGVLQEWIGEKSLDDFGNRISRFGIGLMMFSNWMQFYKEGTAEKARDAGMALAELEKSLPAQDGVLQWWMGEQNLGDFGDRAKKFAEGFVEFSTKMQDYIPGTAETAKEAGGMLADLEASLQSNGGILSSIFFGDKSLSSFGDRLKEFGDAIVGFSETISGNINYYAIANCVKSATSLADFEKDLDETGGLGSVFFGDSSLKNFGKNLDDLGNGMYELSCLLIPVHFDLLGNAIEWLQDLVSLTKLESASKRVVTAAGDLMEKVDTSIKNNELVLKERGRDILYWIVAGIEQGVKRYAATGEKAMDTLATKLIERFEADMEISSPSAVMAREGVWVVKGLAEGIDSDTSAEEAIAKKAQNIVSAFETAISLIGLQSENRQAKFSLWQLTDGLGLSEQEIQNESLKQSAAELEELVKQADIRRIAFEEIRKITEEGSKEYIEAETAWYNAQVKVYELKNQIDELQKTNTATSGRLIDDPELARMRNQANWMKEYSQYYKMLYPEEFGEGKEDYLKMFLQTEADKLFPKSGTAAGLIDTDAIVQGMFSDAQVEYVQEEVAKKTSSAVGSGISAGVANAAEQIAGGDGSGGNPVLNAIVNSVTNGDAAAALKEATDTITKYTGSWIEDGAYAGGLSFDEGLGNGLRDAVDTAKSAAKDVADKGVVQTVTDIFKTGSPSRVAFEIGGWFDQGLANGIVDGTPEVSSSVQNLANAALEILNDALGVASPSKKTYETGKFFAVGFINGIYAQAEQIREAAAEQASIATSALSGALGMINDVLSNDASPTITPVLNMDTLKAQAGEANKLLTNSIKVGSTSNRVKTIAQQQSENLARQNGSQAGQTNYNFTQNNYSPKALSRADIYRDTKNQFSQLKGATRK